jgi:hypothetical protein
MACMTLTAQSLAMATTQLARVAHEECTPTWHVESTVERTPLRMSWVVVTDSDGKQRLRMRWTSDC